MLYKWIIFQPCSVILFLCFCVTLIRQTGRLLSSSTTYKHVGGLQVEYRSPGGSRLLLLLLHLFHPKVHFQTQLTDGMKEGGGGEREEYMALGAKWKTDVFVLASLRPDPVKRRCSVYAEQLCFVFLGGFFKRQLRVLNVSLSASGTMGPMLCDQLWGRRSVMVGLMTSSLSGLRILQF